MATKKLIIAELNREQAMRRKVWRRQGEFFTSMQQQQQYDIVQSALDVFGVMSDADFNRYSGIVASRDGAEQGALF